MGAPGAGKRRTFALSIQIEKILLPTGLVLISLIVVMAMPTPTIMVSPMVIVVILVVPVSFVPFPAFPIVVVVRMRPARSFQTEDAPNVPAPTCNGGPPASNILRSKRIPRLEEAQVLHKRWLVAGSRCTPKSVLNSARQSRLRAVRQPSRSISS